MSSKIVMIIIIIFIFISRYINIKDIRIINIKYTSKYKISERVQRLSYKSARNILQMSRN